MKRRIFFLFLIFAFLLCSLVSCTREKEFTHCELTLVLDSSFEEKKSEEYDLLLTDGEIAVKVGELFDLRPKAIEERLKLRNPIYSETAAYGHVGRTPETVTKTFTSRYLDSRTVTVELFTWEKLDYVEKVKETFAL